MGQPVKSEKSYKADNSIVERAKFDIIRYAQGWEDTDILRKALQIRKGDVCLSICAAGDNTLSLLLDDPAKILAIDLSPAQLACLRLRMVMYKELNHQEFLELFGSIKSDTRMAFLDRCTKHLSDEDNVMWHNYRKNIQAYGIGGIGKFERYFRIFRTCILPLVHSRQTISDLLTEKPQNERELFYNRTWNSFTWRMLLRGFFSRTMMGRLGRDPAFFSYVTGSVADHVMRRVKHAFTELNPSENPYLFWILTGRHQHALPVALRQENYDIIRSRLDRVTVMQTDIERLPSLGFRFNAYNLSDIFEYMSAAYFEKIYSILLACAAPQARMAYWNMMVPRAVPERFRNLINSDFDLAQMLHNEDKTFFYDRFVVEQVKERLA
jgi:S-adenosylmethionine-diacylglycerol 3-amino-3-carboxypropyl transferase